MPQTGLEVSALPRCTAVAEDKAKVLTVRYADAHLRTDFDCDFFAKKRAIGKVAQFQSQIKRFTLQCAQTFRLTEEEEEASFMEKKHHSRAMLENL